MIANGSFLEYMFTIGIAVSFFGLIIGAIIDRKNIADVLRSAGLKKRDLLIPIIIVLAFVAVELYLIKPTQLIFFDDAIYQSMSIYLLHTGQAWMCNFGSPTQCFSGQVFHEPIGLSFNIALAFAVLGVNRTAAYAAELVLASVSVFMTFMVAMLILKDKRSALFSALILALTPLILEWAMPTNSDIAVLAYSLISIFMLLIFTKKKSRLSLLNFLLSVSLFILYESRHSHLRAHFHCCFLIAVRWGH